MTWETYMKFPVAYRKWLIDRISKEIDKAQKAQSDIPTKAPHHNDATMRAMLGKSKQVTPNAKMQRFT